MFKYYPPSHLPSFFNPHTSPQSHLPISLVLFFFVSFGLFVHWSDHQITISLILNHIKYLNLFEFHLKKRTNFSSTKTTLSYVWFGLVLLGASAPGTELETDDIHHLQFHMGTIVVFFIEFYFRNQGYEPEYEIYTFWIWSKNFCLLTTRVFFNLDVM